MIIEDTQAWKMSLVLLGIALLIGGRRLFWLFASMAGFFAGWLIAGKFSDTQAIVFTCAGVTAAGTLVLSILVHKLALIFAGFLGGGYVIACAYLQTHHLFNLPEGMEWAAFLIGGLAGTIVIARFFHWAIIALSSVAGAFIIVGHGLGMGGTPLEKPLLTFLALIGFTIQAFLFSGILPGKVKNLRQA